MNSTEPVYTRQAVVKTLEMIKWGNIDPEIVQTQLAVERASSGGPSNLSGNGDLEDNEDLDDSLLMSYSTEDQVQLSSKCPNCVCGCKVQLGQSVSCFDFED